MLRRGKAMLLLFDSEPGRSTRQSVFFVLLWVSAKVWKGPRESRTRPTCLMEKFYEFIQGARTFGNSRISGVIKCMTIAQKKISLVDLKRTRNSTCVQRSRLYWKPLMYTIFVRFLWPTPFSDEVRPKVRTNEILLYSHRMPVKLMHVMQTFIKHLFDVYKGVNLLNQ